MPKMTLPAPRHSFRIFHFFFFFLFFFFVWKFAVVYNVPSFFSMKRLHFLLYESFFFPVISDET